MSALWDKYGFVLAIDLGVAVVGFLLSISWWKLSGRDLDATAIRFAAMIWLGILAFGIFLLFVM